MLKVGFITKNHYPRLGGMEFATHYLAKNLNNLNNVKASVACSTLRGVPTDFQYPYDCYRAKSFSIFTSWLSKLNQENMIKRESIDILHGQMLHGGGYLAYQLSRKFNLPFVVQSHGADVQVVEEINYGAILDSNKLKYILEVIKAADKIIAVSELNKSHLVNLGAKPDKVTIVPNGIDIQSLKNLRDEDLRSQWGVDENDFLLLTVGRNRPIKRLELLFKAISKLKDKEAIKVVCVGPVENLKELAKKYDVLRKVVFVGRIPKVNNYDFNPPFTDLIDTYKSSDVYVSTSYVESFGMASLEALACGTPIIVGAQHGISDVIDENNSGWIIEEESPDALANLILHLYDKREFLRSKKEEIMNSVSHLDWSNIAEQTLKVYREAL